MSQTRDNVRAQARRMRMELGVVSTDLERLIRRRRRTHRRPRATVAERHHLVELRGCA